MSYSLLPNASRARPFCVVKVQEEEAETEASAGAGGGGACT